MRLDRETAERFAGSARRHSDGRVTYLHHRISRAPEHAHGERIDGRVDLCRCGGATRFVAVGCAVEVWCVRVDLLIRVTRMAHLDRTLPAGR